MNRSDRRAQGVTEGRPGVGREERAVTAAGPLVIGPHLLDVRGGVRGPWTEEAREALEDARAAFGRGPATEFSRLAALEESEQDARSTVRWRVVEDDLDRSAVTRQLPGQSLVAPERFVVDRHALDHRAVRRALGQLVTRRGQRRLVDQAPGQCRTHGHDDARSSNSGRFTADDEIVAVGDSTYRITQHDDVTELVGHRQRDALRTADDPALLGAALGRYQALEVVRRTAVREEVQQ